MTATSERQRAGAAGSGTGVRVIRPDQHTTNTAQTPGFTRQELVASPGAWVGITRTPAGSASGWHHHGDYETYIYVLEGQARMDFGPGGRESCDAGPGDLVVVPKGEVHREANTGDGENAALIIRVGTGDPVFNVDGPAAG